jgi:hypothetical protein
MHLSFTHFLGIASHFSWVWRFLNFSWDLILYLIVVEWYGRIEKKGFFMLKGWCVSLKCSFSFCEVCLQGSQSQWVYRDGTRLVSQSSKTYPIVSCGRCEILFCWIYLLWIFFPEEIIIHVHKIHIQRIVYVFLFFKQSYFMKFHFCVVIPMWFAIFTLLNRMWFLDWTRNLSHNQFDLQSLSTTTTHMHSSERLLLHTSQESDDSSTKLAEGEPYRLLALTMQSILPSPIQGSS